MHRSASRVLAFGFLSFFLAGCSGGPEQTLIGQFFNASRLRDNSSLDNIATVIFDPQTQGTVTTFTVTNISPEDRKPLPLKSLSKAQDDAKAEDDAFSKRKDEYQTANLEAIQRVLKAERGEGNKPERERLLREAASWFEKTLAIDSEDLAAHYNLSLIYAQLGDEARAKEHRDLHRRYKPDDNAADRAIAIARMKDPAANHAAEAVVIYNLQREGAYELQGSAPRTAQRSQDD